MNKIERIKMVKAMEYITRKLNDEDLFFRWLVNGVADGDINYGDLAANDGDEEALYCYYEDDSDFADLMEYFLYLMYRARKDKSGLYCDNVVSKEKE
jgi:hypothetical protein